ncbi:MAG TPA: hypothetical protein VE981_09780 [Planctomycetota bacterium]|nr:hypothetical protein [Planctomycetota bacterium]
MDDETSRKGREGGFLLLLGILLAPLAAAVFLPLWKCPECEILSPPKQFIAHEMCGSCKGKGRRSLYQRWAVVQALRSNHIQ